jgi:hypothetical protein
VLTRLVVRAKVTTPTLAEEDLPDLVSFLNNPHR